LLEISLGEAAPKSSRQISGKPLQQRLAVGCAPASALLLINNSTTDCPVGGRHQGIHFPSGRASGLLQQAKNIAQNPVVSV
jgi:hypothetical protein